MNSTATMEMTPLAITLADLQNAGVTDVVCDVPFNHFEHKVDKTTTNYQPPISTTALVAQVKNTQNNPVDNSTHTLESPSVKIEEIPIKIYGKGNKLTVILTSNNLMADKPLPDNAYNLLSSMLAAINIKMDDICTIAVSETNSFGSPFTKPMWNALKPKLEHKINNTSAENILIIGQDIATALLGETVSLTTINPKQYLIANKMAMVIAHPNLLLKQSGLKRFAWVTLLKFRQGINK